MSGMEIVLGVILGLIVNEMCDISPWLAKKLVHRAAYLQFHDSDEAAGQAEEWTAMIDDRPGKLLKLFTAIGFFASSAAGRARQTLTSDRMLALFFSLIARLIPGPLYSRMLGRIAAPCAIYNLFDKSKRSVIASAIVIESPAAAFLFKVLAKRPGQNWVVVQGMEDSDSVRRELTALGVLTP
ncbi:hypothetical protein ACFV0L_18650 [Streptosporangium canum]|uniref:hypothetical protein n=1 Tax=Streptosporangium canum TaxID=324952 RepID=UPI0036CCA634